MASAATISWTAGSNGAPFSAVAGLSSGARAYDTGQAGQMADIPNTASSRTLKRRAQRKHTCNCLKTALLAFQSLTKVACKQTQLLCPIVANDLGSLRAYLFNGHQKSLGQSLEPPPRELVLKGVWGNP